MGKNIDDLLRKKTGNKCDDSQFQKKQYSRISQIGFLIICYLRGPLLRSLIFIAGVLPLVALGLDWTFKWEVLALYGPFLLILQTKNKSAFLSFHKHLQFSNLRKCTLFIQQNSIFFLILFSHFNLSLYTKIIQSRKSDIFTKY